MRTWPTVCCGCDGFSVEAAHCGGMSLGGLIGQLLAMRDPARILSLTLIAAEPLGGKPIDATDRPCVHVISPQRVVRFDC